MVIGGVFEGICNGLWGDYGRVSRIIVDFRRDFLGFLQSIPRYPFPNPFYSPIQLPSYDPFSPRIWNPVRTLLFITGLFISFSFISKAS
jgi:hypothetical protein